MDKWIEYSLMAVGGILFMTTVLSVMLAPLALMLWVFVKHMLPLWTPIHTFGAIVILGVFSAAWIISDLCGSK